MKLTVNDNLEAANCFDCWHCGDGDALREDESCAYCGRDEKEAMK
jgi:hypothetical protein